jgi:GH15 family glucan-1,4-alpha-glucosidase
VDWWCPPRFDGAAVLCQLLDARLGGYWRVAPAHPISVARSYKGETNVLETTWTTSEGRLRVTDFMPLDPRPADQTGYDIGASHRIVRLIEALDAVIHVNL